MIFEIKCRHCSRFLGTADKSTTVTIKCSNSKCKKLETYKIVFLSDYASHRHSLTSTDKLKVEHSEQSSQERE